LCVDAVLEAAHALNVADDAGGLAMPVGDSGVRMVLEVGQPDAWSRPARAEFGDPTVACEPPQEPLVQPDEVRLTLCIDLTHRPLCNWLFSFDENAADLNGRSSRISSLVKKE
jgi:hypothetical protein